jgi:uncharacterized phage-associated protein
MVVSAHDIARELRRRVPGAGVVKIHKLLYYCQGWHLTWSGQPLFRESVEAWANGPVVADLWHDEDKGRSAPATTDLNEEALGTVGYVVARYGGLSGKDLIHLTHGEAPWMNVSESDSWSSPEISHTELTSFFSEDEDRVRLDAALDGALRDDAVRPVFEAAFERAAGSVGTVDEPVEIQRRLRALS